ncbi:MAG: outer membrane protein assembly factor BamA [Gemmatimonadales bacterium]|nr:outer membrane protein assembly factor BamA [Gemmatimonadales bacterium]
MAQEAEVQAPPVDSLAVDGLQRVTRQQVIQAAGIVPGQAINYRDVQRALGALYRTGQFDDVRAEQREVDGKLVLAFVVTERPVLERWGVRGVRRLNEKDVRDRVRLLEGRPLDRIGLERGRFAIDSLYHLRGFYAARVEVLTTPQPNGTVRVVYDIDEGARIAISQVRIEGNERFRDRQVVEAMQTRPEGFLWLRKGDYDEKKVEQDVRDKLPTFYGDRGHIDFQVLRDTLMPDSAAGKAVLRIDVEEGPRYVVGDFAIIGNRRFSTDELLTLYPFGPLPAPGSKEALHPTRPFNRTEWDAAVEKVREQYANNGYIYSRLEAEESRRVLEDGTHVLDLKWVIREGAPAIINKIEIVGNDVTHERVIREAIVLLPGQVFNRSLLIRSYQNVGNLGFFQQPMPPPDVQPTENGQDVNITFRVEERRTGNINFGASVGQGTGLGGFIGLEEPNLFGRGKRGRLQWQFGANIQDFNLTYSDPAIAESRISGTASVFDSRFRFIVGNLGRRRTTGYSLQLGFPFLGSRYTRFFVSHGVSVDRLTEGSEEFQATFRCAQCTRVAVGASLLRDTRVGLPFATGGQFTNVSFENVGGPLGGTADYRKVDFDTRFYAPLGQLGGGGAFGSGIQLVLGFTAKSGFVFGNAGPFFTQLYSLGGVQFGVPLRGYPEFSIRPDGFDPRASLSFADPAAFGKAYAVFTVEAGARLSQQFYVSAFFDAGNNYREPRMFNPTRLYRGAGFGIAVVSPLGPIGVDLGYGFDRVDAQGRPNPSWQLHFRLGNFF